jgi:hypothetical protein
VLVSVLLAGCNLVALDTLTPTPGRLSAGFVEPATGARVSEGAEVVFQLVGRDESRAAGGVVRLELYIDSTLVASAVPQTGVPEPVFTATMNWRAAGPGLHPALAIAYGADGTASEPAAIAVFVEPARSPGVSPPASPSRSSPDGVGSDRVFRLTQLDG